MTLSICHMRIHDRHSSPLVRTARCLLAVLCLLLAAWVLPWLYRFATAGKQDTPFALYSHITGGFAFAGRSGGQARYYGADGQEFTESAFDSILPFFYFRQLTADGRFPDSISGVAVTPHDVQRSNFTFRTTPQECNRKGVPLYPLLESRSGRVDLTMPDDVFRMERRMEFSDMRSTSVNEDKSRAFTSMLEKKGFAFPPSLIAGNGTARKEYDNGYMMTDAAGKLYNVRMQAGRPYVRPIAMPDGVCPAHMAVTEFRARDMLAFLFDTQGRFWVLTSEYDMMQVEIPPFYPERMSMVIIGNMFDWTIRVGADDGEHLYAVDAQTLERIGTYTFPQPEPSVAERIGKYLLPVKLTFLSAKDRDVYPRFSFFSE